MEVRRVHASDPEGVEALEGWARYERALYGDHPELQSVDGSVFEPPDGAFFVVISEDSTVVAGGGLRRMSADRCEVKRMWTAPDQRRRGYASAVLDAIEVEARRLGYRSLCLETGAVQREALGLYEKRYSRIEPYHYDDAIAFGHSWA